MEWATSNCCTYHVFDTRDQLPNGSLDPASVSEVSSPTHAQGRDLAIYRRNLHLTDPHDLMQLDARQLPLSAEGQEDGRKDESPGPKVAVTFNDSGVFELHCVTHNTCRECHECNGCRACPHAPQLFSAQYWRLQLEEVREAADALRQYRELKSKRRRLRLPLLHRKPKPSPGAAAKRRTEDASAGDPGVGADEEDSDSDSESEVEETENVDGESTSGDGITPDLAVLLRSHVHHHPHHPTHQYRKYYRALQKQGEEPLETPLEGKKEALESQDTERLQSPHGCRVVEVFCYNRRVYRYSPLAQSLPRLPDAYRRGRLRRRWAAKFESEFDSRKWG